MHFSSLQAQIIDSTFQYASPGASSVTALASDSKGNIYVAGYFTDSVKLNNKYPLAGNRTASLMYLTSFSAKGELRFTRLFSTGVTAPIQLERDEENNIYLGTLFTLNKVYLNTEQNQIIGSGYGQQAFVLKMDSLGNHLWHIYTSGTIQNSNVESAKFEILEDNSVLWQQTAKGGISSHTSDDYNYRGFSSVGNANTNRYGALIFRAKPNNTFRYPALYIGNANAGISNATFVEHKGKFVVAGQLNGTVDFDPSTNTRELTSSNKGFYVCFDTAMNFQWAQPSDLHRFSRMEVNSFNQIKGFGTYPGTGTTKLEFSSIDFDGNIQYEYSESFNSATLVVNDIESDRGGNVFISGTFGGYGDFDPTSNTDYGSTGTDAAFLVKYDSSGKVVWKITGSGNGTYTNKGLAIDLDENNRLLWGGAYSRTFYFSGNAATSPPYTTHVLGFLSYLTECRSLRGNMNITDTTICSGNTVSLKVNGGNSVLWEDDSSSSKSRIVNPVVTKNYPVIITNDSGCFQKLNTRINVNKRPEPVIELKDSQCFLKGNWTIIKWYYNNAEVPNENGSFYRPSHKGDVYCEVTDDKGCTGTSNHLQYSVGIMNMELNPNLRIYYSNSFLHVESETDLHDFTISVYDLKGTLLFNLKTEGFVQKTSFPTNLPASVYWVVIQDGAGKIYYRKVAGKFN